MFESSRGSGIRLALIALLLASTGCQVETAGKAQAHRAASARSAPVDTALVRAGDSTVFPSGPEGASARRGFAILAATRDSMRGYVGAGLRCLSCHLDNGRRANGIPFTGAYARYPHYVAREGRMMSIQDRVNACFRRSLAGHGIPVDGMEMNDIVTYLALVSRGVAVGTHVTGEGLPTIPTLSGDTSRGASIYARRCARCHGDKGQGISPATPLWGARSYSIGASLARVGRAATFVRHNMPLDSAGVLSDQQSYDVAAYIMSHPRPDMRGKERDWSAGGAPSDVPYDTRGHAAFNPPRLLLSAFH